MKRFHYIDENNNETLDMLHLFEYAFQNSEINTNELLIAIKNLQEIVDIKFKEDE